MAVVVAPAAAVAAPARRQPQSLSKSVWRAATISSSASQPQFIPEFPATPPSTKPPHQAQRCLAPHLGQDAVLPQLVMEAAEAKQVSGVVGSTLRAIHDMVCFQISARGTAWCHAPPAIP